MIDVETDIFTSIAQALRTAYPGCFVTGEYVMAPARFPHISIVESDNYTSEQHRDTSDKERFSTLMYEINVYSNRTSGKKAECKSIMNLIDEMMYSMNFLRLSMVPIPNGDDPTIYRITARYRAETDGNRIYKI